MPCVRAAELQRQQEHSAANRRDVDPYEGIMDPVQVLEVLIPAKERRWVSALTW